MALVTSQAGNQRGGGQRRNDRCYGAKLSRKRDEYRRKSSAALRRASSTPISGVQPRRSRVFRVSTCRDARRRRAKSRPRGRATKPRSGGGSRIKRAGYCNAAPNRVSNSAVERSSPSLTRNVWLPACGCATHVRIKSTRLSSATRLRRFVVTAPKGNGIPLRSHTIIDRKLALTPG